MKSSVLLISILFALIFVFGIATIKGNSGIIATVGKIENEPNKIKGKLGKDTITNTLPIQDVYNDGNNDADLAQVTKNIEYAFASSVIRPIYKNNLNKLAKLIIEDKYVVSLRGHADSVGSYKPNWMLSEKRAIKVKDYLVSKGVDKDKVITIPFGSTVPIATNNTDAGRQKNRRVEIKLKEVNQ